MNNQKKKHLIELLERINSRCVQAVRTLKERSEELSYSSFIEIQENLDQVFDHLIVNQDMVEMDRVFGEIEGKSEIASPIHQSELDNLRSAVNLIIIDDENTILQMFTEFFHGKNVHVILLDRGENIRQVLEQHPETDVIMTDIRMPEVSGLDILKQVKSSPYSDVEVILMSAYRDVSVLMEGIEQGAFSFVFKPFNLNYLLNQIFKAYTFKHMKQNERIIRSISPDKSDTIPPTTTRIDSEIENFINSVGSLLILVDRNLKIITSNFRHLSHLSIERKHSNSLCDVFQCNTCNDCVFRRAILSLDNHYHNHLQVVLKSKLQPAMMYLNIGITVFDPVAGLYLFNIEDITNQKTQELQRFYKERLIALGRISMGISHEVNQPLNGISTIIQNHLLKLNRKEIIPRDSLVSDDMLILDEIKKISRIIDNLKIFGRPYKQIEYENVNIMEVLRKVLRLLNPILQQNGIEFQFDIPNNEIWFYGNEFHIQEIFMNLINNAADSIEEKQKRAEEACHGEISIRLKESDEWIRIWVQDNGVGIPHDDLYYIFDPFFTTKDVGRGTGLGLSITYGIVKSYLGDIWATSDVGSGSEFEIALPKSGARRTEY